MPPGTATVAGLADTLQPGRKGMTADRDGTSGGVTRRDILAGAAALAASQAGSALAQQAARPGSQPAAHPGSRQAGGGGVLAWVGTYTPNGEGIHLFRMEPATGALTPVKAFGGITNPSWLALAPDGKTLYAVSEVDDFKGTGNGAVVAYTVDHAGGDLTEIGRV